MYKNPVNNGINYQPQLVGRIPSINSMTHAWNPNDLYFWRSTPQKKAFSNQNKGHLGSRYTYVRSLPKFWWVILMCYIFGSKLLHRSRFYFMTSQPSQTYPRYKKQRDGQSSQTFSLDLALVRLKIRGLNKKCLAENHWVFLDPKFWGTTIYFMGILGTPPKATPPPSNKGLIAGLIKGNQWLINPL